MTYQNIQKATFLSRPNRFIAKALLDNQEVTVHVKNTGRCKELLTVNATIYLEYIDSPTRKTKYDLIAVEKDSLLINMDAQAPNKVFREWAEQGNFHPPLSLLKSEKTYGNSRFDFYWESQETNQKGFTELKGVTLETDGIACFPDAPTERGVKHIEELILAKKDGYHTSICFLIQMQPMKELRPNDITHPAFGDALRKAKSQGVEIFALDCTVTPTSLTPKNFVPVIL